MNPVALFNAFEVGMWLVMALIVAVLCVHASDRYRKTVLSIGALLLMAFAGSDAVEFYTGAWWRPWWLLCWKGVCIIGLLSVAIAYWMDQQRIKSQINDGN
jgi:hypothetical protein